MGYKGTVWEEFTNLLRCQRNGDCHSNSEKELGIPDLIKTQLPSPPLLF